MYKIQEYVMKWEEVPECWKPELKLTSYDIVSHAIDELLEEELDFEEFTN